MAALGYSKNLSEMDASEAIPTLAFDAKRALTTALEDSKEKGEGSLLLALKEVTKSLNSYPDYPGVKAILDVIAKDKAVALTKPPESGLIKNIVNKVIPMLDALGKSGGRRRPGKGKKSRKTRKTKKTRRYSRRR